MRVKTLSQQIDIAQEKEIKPAEIAAVGLFPKILKFKKSGFRNFVDFLYAQKYCFFFWANYILISFTTSK